MKLILFKKNQSILKLYKNFYFIFEKKSNYHFSAFNEFQPYYNKHAKISLLIF